MTKNNSVAAKMYSRYINGYWSDQDIVYVAMALLCSTTGLYLLSTTPHQFLPKAHTGQKAC